MRLACGSELYDVELRATAGRPGEWEAEVNGQPLRLAVTAAGDGRCEVRHAGGTATLHFARDGATLHLFWEGVAYRLARERPGARAARQAHAGALEAPMPGRVSAVKVTVGQAVAKGEELLVIEAMKMENALRAPRAGVVRAIHCGVGAMVAPGAPLVELGEAGEPA